MKPVQPSFTDVEYDQRRRATKRQEFLQRMDATIPWEAWLGLIRPFYYNKTRGRRPIPVERVR